MAKIQSTTSRAQTPIYRIRSTAQLRALNSPVRQEIIDALVAAGPCSIADLAGYVGRAPDSLYFHIRRLLKVGLLIELDPRKTGRHIAAIYDVPGHPVVIDYTSPVPDRAIYTVISGAIRLGMRDLQRGFSSPQAVREGPLRNLRGGRVKGWVGKREIRTLNRLLEQMFDTVRRGRPGKGRHPQTFTFAFTPVRPSRRAPKATHGVRP